MRGGDTWPPPWRPGRPGVPRSYDPVLASARAPPFASSRRPARSQGIDRPVAFPYCCEAGAEPQPKVSDSGDNGGHDGWHRRTTDLTARTTPRRFGNQRPGTTPRARRVRRVRSASWGPMRTRQALHTRRGRARPVPAIGVARRARRRVLPPADGLVRRRSRRHRGARRSTRRGRGPGRAGPGPRSWRSSPRGPQVGPAQARSRLAGHGHEGSQPSAVTSLCACRESGLATPRSQRAHCRRLR